MSIRDQVQETPQAVPGSEPIRSPLSPAAASPMTLTASSLLALQASAGNRAVAALVGRSANRRLGRQETATAEPAAATSEPDAGGAPAVTEEGVSDAPSQRYIVPFDRAPLAAAGERIIFRAEFSDPSPASYQLEFTTTGGTFTTAGGPTTRTIAGLTSGNVDFFMPTPWIGVPAVQVVLKVKKVSDGSVQQTETWNFGLKQRYPTTMSQVEGTGEVNLPGVYHYDIGPVVPPVAPPFYQHQTILERFGNWTLGNIQPADIVEAYRLAKGLSTAAAVSAHFLGDYAGSNGTFTVDANDQIADQHGGIPTCRTSWRTSPPRRTSRSCSRRPTRPSPA